MIRYYESGNGFNQIDQWRPRCWIDVEMPTADEITLLRHNFNIPPQFLEYLSDPEERPRVERDGEWTLTIIRIPIKVDSNKAPYTTVPLGIISDGEVVATVCTQSPEMLSDFVAHTRIKGITVRGVPDFILRILFSATYWFLKYLHNIAEDTSHAEEKLQGNVKNDDLISLMRTQNALVYFNTSITANKSIIERMHTLYHNRIDLDLLEDVEIEARQAEATVKIYSDILAGTLDTYTSVISNNMNAVMKRMTAVSITLMVPTLIASFYGMNVNIGMGNSPIWFWVILGVSALLTTGCMLLLKKLKWF